MFYFINSDSSFAVNSKLPCFKIFQGYQIALDQRDFNIILPGCTFFEKQSSFLDVFGELHRVKPIFSKLKNTVPDWQILFTLLNCLKFNKQKSQLFQSFQAQLPSPLNENINSKETCFIPVPFHFLTAKAIVFNSIISTTMESYYLTDITTRLSKNLAVCVSERFDNDTL